MKFHAVKSIILSIFILTVFCLKGAYMTEIMFRSVNLENVIQESDCIVIAKKEMPNVTKKTIQIKDKIKKTGKECPPFIKETYHFRIVEVLKTGKNIKINSKISVFPAHQQSEMSYHKKYYLEGIGISPIYTAYNYYDKEGLVNRDIYNDSNELILFLKTGDYTAFTFTVERGYEAITSKEKILKIINTKK